MFPPLGKIFVSETLLGNMFLLLGKNSLYRRKKVFSIVGIMFPLQQK